jgi:hypothetical protein
MSARIAVPGLKDAQRPFGSKDGYALRIAPSVNTDAFPSRSIGESWPFVTGPGRFLDGWRHPKECARTRFQLRRADSVSTMQTPLGETLVRVGRERTAQAAAQCPAELSSVSGRLTGASGDPHAGGRTTRTVWLPGSGSRLTIAASDEEGGMMTMPQRTAGGA